MSRRVVNFFVEKDVDLLGMFAIIDGEVYASSSKCDFKNNIIISPDNRVRIAKKLLNGLEKTLGTDLIVERLVYCKDKRIKERRNDKI